MQDKPRRFARLDTQNESAEREEAMTDTTPALKTTNAWARSNLGLLLDVHRTRAEAIKEAEHQCGVPWSVCKRYMEVRKVHVVEGWK
jgi:hypothetical protein